MEYKIKNFEGYYLYIEDNNIKVFSSWGFDKGKPIKEIPRKTLIIEDKRRELTQRINSHGYIMVDLSSKSRQLHRLIAETLISNPNNLECVDHIDGNKLNNHPTNLQWITRGDNVRKAQTNGKWGTPPKSYEINFSNNEKLTITNISQFSRENGYDASKLVALSKGKRKIHKDIISVIEL